MDGELVSQETRGLCAPMGDERFCLGKFQLEGDPDEAGEVAFDFLRFVAWPGKTKQEVIGRA
jgi:hypothetical protein